MPHSANAWRVAAQATLILLLVLGPNAAALAASVSNSYVVTATVLPAREIIVNQAGIIVKIESNTAQPLTPAVFNQSYSKLPLSAAVLTHYNQILSRPGLAHKVGVVYSWSPTVPAAKTRWESRVVSRIMMTSLFSTRLINTLAARAFLAS